MKKYIYIVFLLMVACDDSSDKNNRFNQEDDVQMASDASDDMQEKDGTSLGNDVERDTNDSISPFVVSVKPEDNEQEVNSSTEISALFSEQIKESTLEKGLHLVNENRMEPVSIKMDYKDKVVTLNSTLSLLTNYKATLDNSITDLAGNTLDEKSWSFITRDGEWESKESIASLPTNSIVDTTLVSGSTAIVLSVLKENGISHLERKQYDFKALQWSEVEQVGSQSNSNIFFSLVFDPLGNSTLIWKEGEALWAQRFDPIVSIWSEAKQISTSVAFFGNVFVDALNNVIVLFESLGQRQWVKFDGNNWSSPGGFENAQIPLSAALTSDHKGNIFASWPHRANGGVSIWSNRFDVQNQTWGSAGSIEGVGVDSEKPRMISDKDGNITLVWLKNKHLWSNRYDALSDAWGNAQRLDTTPIHVFLLLGNADNIFVLSISDDRKIVRSISYDNQSLSWNTLIEFQRGDDISSTGPTMDEKGNIHFLWSNSGKVWAVRYDMTLKNWSNPKIISETGFFPALQLDRSGNGMAFWMASNTKTEIWVSRYIADTQTWAKPTVVGSGKEGAFFPLVALQKETGKGILTWLQDEQDHTALYAKIFQ